MTKRNVMSLGLKIIGLKTLIMGIVSFPAILAFGTKPSSFSPDSTPIMLAAQLLTIFLAIAAGAILVGLSDRIAVRIVPEDVILTLPGWLADKQKTLRFVIITFGLIILANNLPSMLYTVYIALKDMLTSNAIAQVAFELRIHQGQALSALIAAGIGAYLVWGSKSVIRLIRAERSNDE